MFLSQVFVSIFVQFYPVHSSCFVVRCSVLFDSNDHGKVAARSTAPLSLTAHVVSPTAAAGRCNINLRNIEMCTAVQNKTFNFLLCLFSIHFKFSLLI